MFPQNLLRNCRIKLCAILFIYCLILWSGKMSYRDKIAYIRPDHFLQSFSKQSEQSDTCKPVHNIYYVKIPKTGSSTMANIIQRIAYVYNLTTAVLYIRNADFIRPFKYLFPHPLDILDVLQTNNESVIKELFMTENYRPVNKYEVYTSHSILDYREIKKSFTHDTKIIATCRDPLRRLISHIHYNRRRLGIPSGENPPEYFLKNIQKYPGKFSNVLAEFLGFYDSSMSIDEYTEFLGHIIDHVVITDKYDESLVLLRRKFCWDMKKILHLDFKLRNYEEKNDETKLKILEDEYREEIKNITKYDYTIYDYFLKRHEEYKQEEGVASIQKEVEILNQLNLKVNDFCLNLCQGVYNTSEVLFIEASEFNDAFVITNYDCILMYLPESKYDELIKEKEYRQVCKHPYFRQNYPQYCPEVGTLKYKYISGCDDRQ